MDLPFQITYVIHRLEIARPSNTVRIARQCLTQCNLKVFGAQGAPMDYELLKSEGHFPFVLFPGSRNIADLAKTRTELPPLQCIIPDGNWPQARKIACKIIRESGLPTYSIHPSQLSQYKLRRDKCQKEGLATLEATFHAVEALGFPDQAKALRDVFELFVNQHLAQRNRSHNLTAKQ